MYNYYKIWLIKWGLIVMTIISISKSKRVKLPFSISILGVNGVEQILELPQGIYKKTISLKNV